MDNELGDICSRLLASNKPKIIAAEYRDEDIPFLENRELRVSLSKCIWQKSVQTSGPYKDMHLGVLLDESLNYVHLIFVSRKFLDCII